MRPAELVEMAFVARQYYIEGETRIEIAKKLSTTRFRVAKILELARESGLVQITINEPTHVDSSLSEGLVARFGLRAATVTTTTSEQATVVRDALGRAAAELISRTTVEGDVIGVASGRTLNAIVPHLRGLVACDVVQLTGLAGGVGDTSSELVRQISALSGGRSFPIYAPLIASDDQAARVFRRQPSILAAFDQFSRVTKAVVAVGSWQPPESQLADSLTAEERERFLARGVRAEICATLMDARGNPIAGVEDRALAINLEQLRAIPEVIVVAGGEHKTQALAAVLKSGVVTTLVTDSRTAERLLKLAR